MRYKHIIWDWNGTLMDDAWLCVEIMNAMLARRGLAEVSMEHYRELFQFPVIRYYETLGFDPVADPFERISYEFIDAYEQRRTECALFPGAEATLHALGEHGLGQSLLSAYKHDTLEGIIDHYGLRGHFHTLSGNDNIYAEGKKERGRALAQSVAKDPSEILLVGDTAHDHEVAHAIGADCVLVAYGHFSRHRLESTGAHVIESYDELLAFVANGRVGVGA